MRTALVSLSNAIARPPGDIAATFPVGPVGPGRSESLGIFVADGGATTTDASGSSAKLGLDLFRLALAEAWATSINATSSDRVRSSLHAALLRTNRQLFEEGFNRVPIHELHISAIGGLIYRGVLVFNAMGNVRLTMLRNGRFHSISDDHSLAGALVRRGLIRGASASRHPFSKLSAKRLGSQPDIHPSFRSVPLRPGDILLFSTDGVGELQSCDQLQRRLGALLGSSDAEPPSAARGVEIMQLLEHQLNFHLRSDGQPPEDDGTVLILQMSAEDMQQISHQADPGDEEEPVRRGGRNAWSQSQPAIDAVQRPATPAKLNSTPAPWIKTEV